MKRIKKQNDYNWVKQYIELNRSLCFVNNKGYSTEIYPCKPRTCVDCFNLDIDNKCCKIGFEVNNMINNIKPKQKCFPYRLVNYLYHEDKGYINYINIIKMLNGQENEDIMKEMFNELQT